MGQEREHHRRSAAKTDRGLVVEPVENPRARPSNRYIQTLRNLGAPQETVELATGERKLRRRLAF